MYRSADRKGFAMVATLVMLALLAVVAAGFLASTASERRTAHAFANAAQAEFAAQAATSEGIAMLKVCFEKYPDSATTWEDMVWNSGPALSGSATQGTFFYYRKQSLASGTASYEVWTRPLVSGGQAVQVTGQGVHPSLGMPHANRTYEDADNSVDLNRARFAGDQAGWIGSLPGEELRKFRVPWVEIHENPAEPASKVIARYAFWVEDESFKVNVNLSETTARGGDTDGSSSDQIPTQGLLRALGSANPEADAAAICDLRQRFANRRFMELGALNYLEGVNLSGSNGGQTLSDSIKFEATLFSSALNVSRHGYQRVNLNAVVSEVLPGATTSAADAAQEIRKQLDQIIEPIRRQSPDFGQRFYRTREAQLNDSQVSSTDAEIYLQKIAANIRDYIDEDSQPTVINNDGNAGNQWTYTVHCGEPSKPVGASITASGMNPIAAIGKENIPYFQEYAARVTLLKFNPAKQTAKAKSAVFKFNLDYYFEFWNMSTKDIHVSDLGPNPFIKVCDQVGFDLGNGKTIAEGRDSKILLSGPGMDDVVFPAGKCTVITSDPHPCVSLVSGSAIVSPFIVPADATCYSGSTSRATSDKIFHVYSIGRYGSGSDGPDYGTGVVLGNDFGLLDSLLALPLTDGNAPNDQGLNIRGDRPELIKTGDDVGYIGFLRGASLMGMKGAPSQCGDPRTNNEQLAFLRYDSNSSNTDQTRYYQTGLGYNTGLANSTLGLPNANFVDPGLWPDYSSSNPAARDAPMVIANNKMNSIGELGHIFDPARKVGPSGDIRFSRGGGRTFTIGQPDPLWDKSATSPSREWAAWRLADIFSVTGDLVQEGRININGVRRDGGRALKAALDGYEFAPDPESDPRLARQPMGEESLEKLVEQLKLRLSGSGEWASMIGPLLERGELSELPVFYRGSDLVTGVETAKTYDRGREELFRRLVELITTRGNTFSVYAIGQTVVQPSGWQPESAEEQRKLEVTATHRMKITFRLEPKWNPPLLETYDPAKPDEAAARFRLPEAYTVKILQVSGF